MSKITFSNKSDLKKWLISTAGVALISVSLMGDIQEVQSTLINPKALSEVIKSFPSYFPDGKYIVVFKNTNEIDKDQIDHSKMVMAISFEVKLANSDTIVDGLKPLLRSLSDFKHCCTVNRSNAAYVTAGIWIVEPLNPLELEALKSALTQHAVFYAFNDGSGYVTVNNGRMVDGVHSTV